MAMIGKIRRMFLRQGKSVREISRITSLSRNTIQKWLDAPLNGEPKYRRRSQASKLTPFEETLKQALKVDAHRPKKIVELTDRKYQRPTVSKTFEGRDRFAPVAAHLAFAADLVMGAAARRPTGRPHASPPAARMCTRWWQARGCGRER